jgi:nitroimidazol reductase NimA-like FMN-containing flavoprotein (pyridoxamine 5'-phosphate oxidase superfamily)
VSSGNETNGVDGGTRAPSAFTRVRRLGKRGAYDPATVYAILDAATHCHVAHVIDGRPVALPTLHWRHEDRLYWHGNAAGRMLRENARASEVCVTATIIEGFVLARSGFNHSVNYRSAMCFGIPSEVTVPSAKDAALRHFLEHWFPGRWATLRPPTRKELAATRVFSIPLDEASAKIREGGPHDPPDDVDWPTWAGVIPLMTRAGLAHAAADFRGKQPAPRLAGIASAQPARRSAPRRRR